MATTERNEKVKIPKRPQLNHLPGSLVLGDEYRKQFNLQDGILQGNVKSWSNVDDLVDTYFLHNLDIVNTAPQVFQETLDALQNIGESDLEKNLSDYAARVKKFLGNKAVRHLFVKTFKRHVDMRERQEEEEERRREEEQAKKRLLHQGKLNGYLASQKGAMEIGASLRSDINNSKR